MIPDIFDDICLVFLHIITYVFAFHSFFGHFPIVFSHIRLSNSQWQTHQKKLPRALNQTKISLMLSNTLRHQISESKSTSIYLNFLTQIRP